MRYSLLLVLFLFNVKIHAQGCNCGDQFAFLQNYFEANNPAFQSIKNNEKKLRAYYVQVSNIKKSASAETTVDLCNVYFEKYLDLLKDNHSKVDVRLMRNKVDLSSPESVINFKKSDEYRSFEKIKIDTAEIIRELTNKPINNIEGLYSSESNIHIAIIKKGAREYRGVVMSGNKLLDVGHVLFYLFRNPDHTFACYYNTGLLGFNFKTTYFNRIRFENGSFPQISFHKNGSKPAVKLWDLKKLNEDTYYLAIPSFDYSLKPQLDSLYQEFIPYISKVRCLVLDIRNNGGGTEQNYFELLPLICSKPLRVDEVQVWVSPDNIRSYETMPYRDSVLIGRMKNAPPFSFIPQKEDAVNEWNVQHTKYPEKVALLQNRGTASSAEGLITYAIQSDKVITLGENTGGYIGYGDVVSTEMPCNQFSLRTTTTKYKNNAKYEFVGIPPMIRLKGKRDWIGAALDHLRARK